ncbi:MAG: YccF domain-containing protein [Cellvibrionaceae bacterium]|nr:YccF domain-containing protein [Cellvibrionaceae bacterium]MCV6626899.1 YccF domain-containing protein [Cellvibrionaceae bacterium]
MLRLVMNIIWLVLGGFVMGLTWLLISLIAFISIIGIPWGRACFNIALFCFWPFGQDAINRAELHGEGDLGTSIFGSIGNIIWFFLAGIWLAIAHVFCAVAYAITIIGIPFAIQHIKFAGISLAPIGKSVVSYEVAAAARARNAAEKMDKMRS